MKVGVLHLASLVLRVEPVQLEIPRCARIGSPRSSVFRQDGCGARGTTNGLNGVEEGVDVVIGADLISVHLVVGALRGSQCDNHVNASGSGQMRIRLYNVAS